ncbi:NAD(P)-dependent oxidoreductase [bacterium]|nr:NAD(P)-dependent oxidoreductase [bacterium]
MKIMILGSKGNLGNQLFLNFSKDDKYEIISLDNHNADFLDLDNLFLKIRKFKPDVLINSVAYNNVDKCESNEESQSLAERLNILLPKKLTDICLEIDCILVSYSSDYVFGREDRDYPYTEWDSPAPVNYYGLTKYKGEEQIIKAGILGLKYYLIRTSKLFGPCGDSKFSKKSFFDVMIEVSKKQAEIKVVDEEVSSFTYTVDLAEYTKYLIEKEYPFGVYHLINKGQATWAQAAEELFKLLKVGIKIIPISGDEYKRPAARPKYSLLINTKMKPLPYWKQSLKDYLDNYYKKEKGISKKEVKTEREK